MTDPTTVSPYIQRDTFHPLPEITNDRDDSGVVHITMPFTPGRTGYAVSRHQDVRDVLSDSTRFRITQTEYTDLSEGEAADLRAGQLLEFDPPEHTRLRRLLTPEFTMRRMRRLEPRIVEIVETALDDLERAASPADLVEAFALPVPSLVICELLGVPYADRDEFQARSRRMVDASLSLEQQTEVFREDHAYMSRLVERAQADPGDDILGMLVREHGAELSTAELTGIASLLLVAGHETTANMLALGTLALLRHPDQLAIVRDEPANVGAAVEELLRWLSVVPTPMVRTATTEVQIAGHSIAAGEQILAALPAANRDPAFVDDPDRLDVRRGSPGHLAFGHGVHHCIGAPLARMEMRIAFPALLQRFPNLTLAVPFDEIQFRANHVVYGLHSLPVEW
jgi:cytochrome P450